MKSKRYSYVNDYYIGVNGEKYDFYYGFEHTYCETDKKFYKTGHDVDECLSCSDDNKWCFVVENKIGDVIFQIPYDKLTKDKMDMANNFLMGISIFFDQYENKIEIKE